MKNWYSSIYKSLILASIVTFLIHFFSKGNMSLGALIAGYTMLIISILMILYVVLFNILQVTEKEGMFQTFLSMIITCGPFLLLLNIIGFVLYLVINYKNRILAGHVPNGYFTFSNITVIMILLQLYILNNGINTEKFEVTKKLSNITTSILYLYGVITAISSITLFMILKNFSADG
jgi:hypothetical protein